VSEKWSHDVPVLTGRVAAKGASAAGAVAVAVLIAGCSSTHKATPATSTAGHPAASSTGPSAPSKPAQGGTALKVGTAEYPTAMTDSAGRAVYLFTGDKGTTSTCTGACATAWPPVTTTGAPSIDAAFTLRPGTTTRTDKTVQVTYNGHPLYYFAKDTGGDVKGESSKAFGGDWYLVDSHGNKIDHS
jgi:predicted lipoprotein with Yx(FWY)xxD motif